jgi:hypothetical protein
MRKFPLLTLCLVYPLNLNWLSLPAAAAPLPENSGAINVKDLGAKGDGATDDTKAIQQALQGANKLVYIPNGTYLVCGTLEWGKPHKRIVLEGQNRDRTIIRLQDKCPRFDNRQQPKPVITTFEGKSTGEAFRNAIYDLTVDVGTGNPGAIAIRFLNNNQGGIRNVNLVSSDPKRRGAIGLALTKAWPGPGLIKNVKIVGFDYGVKIQHPEYSMVFENLTLQNQKTAGIENRGNILSIRRLTSENSVPVIQNLGDDRGLVVVVNGNFSGGSAKSVAIDNRRGVLYTRNIEASGYKAAIKNGNKVIAQNAVREFISQDTPNLFSTDKTSLQLPIQEVPTVPEDDFSNWASITDYGATTGFKKDSTKAIQKAIDSGKTTIYFPKGQYLVTDTIRIRGNVRRIIGMESAILAKGNAFNDPKKPVFRLEDGEQSVVVVERLWAQYGFNAKYWIEQASSRTLVLRNSIVGPYRNTVAGRLFIEDVAARSWEFNQQEVWARQLNAENNGRKVLNNGGKLWILGFKTEKPGTAIETINGGKTELLGGLLYPASSRIPTDQPAFLSQESQISVVIAESQYGRGGRYQTLIRETRNGETRNLENNALPRRGGGSVIPLYPGSKELAPVNNKANSAETKSSLLGIKFGTAKMAIALQ